MIFAIRSEGIIDGVIADKYGKRSNDVTMGIPQLSLPLEWKNAPDDVVSYAIVFQDFDNIKEEGFSWIHWLVANIPEGINALKENASRKMKEIDVGIIQGKNTWIVQYDSEDEACNRYGGPAPISNAHEYEIRIYALNSFLTLDDGFYFNDLLKEMRGKVLAEATTYGKYYSSTMKGCE